MIDRDNPRLLQGSLGNPVVRCQGCGMGDCGLGTRTGPSSFEEDNGFDLGHLTGDLQEPAGILEAFQIHEYGLGLRVICTVLQDLALFHIHLVAHPHYTCHPEVFRRGNIAHGVGGKIPGLGNVGDVPPGDFSQWKETGSELVGCGCMAGGVRADHAHPGFSDGFFKVILQGFPLFVHLCKTTGCQHHGLDPFCRTIPNGLGIQLGR